MDAPESLTRPVVVYDGECPFCRRQVARIQAWAPEGTFEYVPRQTPGLEERFPRLAGADFNTGMRLIRPCGTVDVGADAVYQIARRLRGWRYLAWLYWVPGIHQLARLAYGWVARNRMKLSQRCTDTTCR